MDTTTTGTPPKGRSKKPPPNAAGAGTDGNGKAGKQAKGKAANGAAGDDTKASSKQTKNGKGKADTDEADPATRVRNRKQGTKEAKTQKREEAVQRLKGGTEDLKHHIESMVGVDLDSAAEEFRKENPRQAKDIERKVGADGVAFEAVRRKLHGQQIKAKLVEAAIVDWLGDQAKRLDAKLTLHDLGELLVSITGDDHYTVDEITRKRKVGALLRSLPYLFDAGIPFDDLYKMATIKWDRPGDGERVFKDLEVKMDGHDCLRYLNHLPPNLKKKLENAETFDGSKLKDEHLAGLTEAMKKQLRTEGAITVDLKDADWKEREAALKLLRGTVGKPKKEKPKPDAATADPTKAGGTTKATEKPEAETKLDPLTPPGITEFTSRIVTPLKGYIDESQQDIPEIADAIKQAIAIIQQAEKAALKRLKSKAH